MILLCYLKSVNYWNIFSRECINKVCEAAGLKTADKKRKVSKISNVSYKMNNYIFYVIYTFLIILVS